MRKNILIGIIILIGYISQAQNTFPTSGSVGIGTSNPAALLHVFNPTVLGSSTGSVSEIARIAGNVGNNMQVKFQTYRYAAGSTWYSASMRLQLSVDNDVNPIFPYLEFAPQGNVSGMAFGSGNQEIMRLLNNGNVGIGTTNPVSILSIKGNRSLANKFDPSLSAFQISSGGNMIMDGNEIYSDASLKLGWAPTSVFDLGYVDATSFTSVVRINTNGNIGIGTTSPVSKLEVKGRITSGDDGTTSGSFAASNILTGNPFFTTTCTASGNGILNLYSSAGTNVVLLNTSGTSYFNGGNVLIGKTSQSITSYKLDVSGNARADKLTVNTTGADFVFDSTYDLLTLSEVENFIREHHHLPQVASAAQMQKEGLDLGENQTRLLQKTEELTLYLIEQNKKLNAQDKKIKELESIAAEQQKKIDLLLSKLTGNQ